MITHWALAMGIYIIMYNILYIYTRYTHRMHYFLVTIIIMMNEIRVYMYNFMIYYIYNNIN